MPFIVYEWMVQNVPYFRDKGDSNSSAGWKVCLSSTITFLWTFMLQLTMDCSTDVVVLELRRATLVIL